MLILGLDSSAKTASCAVYDTDKKNILAYGGINAKITHSETLLPLCESVLKAAKLTLNDIDTFAVTNGPGSFTGVRIGVSAAKGLAWGAEIPVCGVSTLEAMAFQTVEPDLIICPVMDARRSQVYNALFKRQNDVPVRLCEDRALSLESLANELREIGTACLLVGDGAALSYDFLRAVGIPCRMAADPQRWQTAYGVALAAVHASPVPAIELEPNYLRPSQAERELGMRN